MRRCADLKRNATSAQSACPRIAVSLDVRKGGCGTVETAAGLSQLGESRQLIMRSARLSKDRRVRRTVNDTLPTIIRGQRSPKGEPCFDVRPHLLSPRL